jgi:triacylglycerol lipase
MMKRASTLVCAAACLSFNLVGCSSAAPVDETAPPTLTPTTNNEAVSRGGRPDSPEGALPKALSQDRAPIVLVHGFSGFKNIGPLEYFYGVRKALIADGHQVFVAQVDPYNDSYVRGAQLQSQVEAILAETGADHVNLIGHSQGGLDCRYVANKLGNLIGAVVMVSTPNRGDPVADVALGYLPGPIKTALGALLVLFGETVLDPSGHPNSNAQAALYALSSAGAAEFNQNVPDDPDVQYFSFAGRANNDTADADCGSSAEPSWIAAWGGRRDETSLLMKLPAWILSRAAPGVANDGLVTVASAKWGTFLGCVPADHIQEVCQIANLSKPSSGFNCVAFYRSVANWLVARGF